MAKEPEKGPQAEYPQPRSAEISNRGPEGIDSLGRDELRTRVDDMRIRMMKLEAENKKLRQRRDNLQDQLDSLQSLIDRSTTNQVLLDTEGNVIAVFQDA